jgi:hypothetical protein
MLAWYGTPGRECSACDLERELEEEQALEGPGRLGHAPGLPNTGAASRTMPNTITHWADLGRSHPVHEATVDGLRLTVSAPRDSGPWSLTARSIDLEGEGLASADLDAAKLEAIDLAKASAAELAASLPDVVHGSGYNDHCPCAACHATCDRIDNGVAGR